MQLLNRLFLSEASQEGSAQGDQVYTPPRKALHEDDANVSWDSQRSIPSLGEVTVYSCSSQFDDDGSSVSSICSGDHIEHNGMKPRSIFKEYWNKSGGRPRSNSDSMAMSPISLQNTMMQDFQSEHANGSTDTPPALPILSAPISPASRRRIFGAMSGALSDSLSERTPPPMPLLPKLVRKSKSSSSIPLGAPKGSCLRPTRFSGRNRRSSDASDSESSVKFRNEVDIITFERPLERWAAKGWDNWFA